MERTNSHNVHRWHSLIGLRQIRFEEIVDVAAFDLVGEAMLYGALIDGAHIY